MALLQTARKPKASTEKPAPPPLVATERLAQKPSAPDAYIALDAILPPISNPRRRFGQVAMNELTESIRENGVLQPVLLRRLDGGQLRLVAGERRLRAAREAGLDRIPALIRTMTDAEERRFAMLENTHREDMFPTEESDRAALVLTDCKGDLSEAAKRLGWGVRKLERRLALQNLVREAVEALESDAISLGHAELLAGVSTEIQQDVLPRVLREKLDLGSLRDVLLAKSCNLARACFDTAECTNCTSNSSRQIDFFSTTLDVSATCTKPSCFNAKTEAHLQGIADKLVPTYPLVRIVRIGDVQPVAVTPETVSAAQHSACLLCASYGAAVFAIPGREGFIHEGGCFDLACNAEKRAALREAQERAARAAAEATGEGFAANDDDAFQSGDGLAADEAEEQQPNELTRRMREYREQIWREAVARHIEAGGNENPAAILLAQRVREGVIDLESVRLMGEAFNVDIGLAFSFDEAFLGLLAATEIRGVCERVGLSDYLRQMKGGERQFISMTCGLKEEIIEAVLSVPGFDYRAAVPAFMRFEGGCAA